jgi:hypothetical protein
MKRFIIKFTVFAIICVALAYALQLVVDDGLRKSNFSDDNRQWDDITASHINADIIIQGSSKAWRQFSPLAFEQAFNMNTYNLGLEGHCFPMQKWRSDVYLRHNKKPRYIIQEVALNEMTNPVISYNYIQFIPYLNEGFMDRFGGHSYLTYKDLYIPLYKYTHKTGLMESGLVNHFKKQMPHVKKYKGFLATNLHWSDTDLVAVKKQFPGRMMVHVSPVAYSAFIDQINYCKKEHITLILVCPPTHNSFQNWVINKNQVMDTYRRLSVQYKVKFLDYSNDAMCNDTSVFYNFNHLNVKGVNEFNKKLIADLKPDIK